MTPTMADCAPLLREALAEARAAGLALEADALEQATLGTAFTTSSELLQEQGLAIQRFLQATRDALPRATTAKLEACLTAMELSQPGWKQLRALLKTARAFRSGPWP